MDIEMTTELKTIALLSGFVRELVEGKKTYEELNYEYADRIVKLFSQPTVSERFELLKSFVDFYNERQNSSDRICYDEIDIYIESL